MTVRRAILGTLIALTLLAFPAQFLIDSSAENMACVCIILTSSLAVFLYVGWTRALELQPISTFAVLGFCAITQFGAIFVQTLAWTPVSKSLYAPLSTFATLALYLLIALLTHAAYRFVFCSKPARTGFFRGLLGKAGLYQTPSCGALWFMGGLGLITFFLARHEGPVAKFFMAFNFLAWTPFLIPVYLREVGDSYCNASRNRLFLGLYIMVIGFLGIALNMRGIMFVGALTVALLFLLAGMRGRARVTRRSLIALGALLTGLLVFSGPISDLTTSMVIARQWRGKLSPIEMIKTTYGIMQRPALIAAVRAESAASARYAAYDEYYIANPVLARFVTTKYHDNMLHFAAAMTDSDKAMLADISVKFMWSAIPGPLLDALHIGIDKEVLNGSVGDYLRYFGGAKRPGGHVVGSIFAHGIALFGPLFPFIYAALCLGLFGMMDLLTVRSESGAATVSALGMLQIWTYFSSGIVYDGLQGPFHFFVRNFWQAVLIYALAFALARMVVRPKQSSVREPNLPPVRQFT